MDPFAVIIFGGLAGIVAALLLIGRFYPGNGSDVVDWRPTRSPEVEAENELDDMAQMLEAANRRRRRRGATELTEESLRQSVADDVRERHARSDRYTADEEIDQMLYAKNRRRKAKGLPEITAEDFRRELEAGS